MSLSYIKGIRTRYYHLLEKELVTSKRLLEQDYEGDDDEITSLLRKITASLMKFHDYIEKFESACEKLAIATETVEDETQKQKLSVEDDRFADFLCHVIENRSELAAFEKFLREQKTEIQKKDSKLDELLGIQTELMKKLVHQTTEKLVISSESVRLPKIEIPTFDGNILTFKEFWDAFEVCIDNNKRLSPVEKFTYLKSKLLGDALKAVEGLSLCSVNYSVALQILRERFGEEQLVINAHYRALMDIHMPTNCSVSSLRTLCDEMEKHFRSLEALAQDITSPVFVSIILSKLPREVVLHLEMNKPHHERWTVQILREQLSHYVIACETADTQAFTSELELAESSMSSENVSSKKLTRSTAEALVAGAKPAQVKCVFCEQDHWSDECKKYPTMDTRKEKIRGRCFICLSKYHLIRECVVNRPCYYCNQRRNHHRSLCPDKFTTKLDCMHIAQEEKPKMVEISSLVSSEEMVLMKMPDYQSYCQIRITTQD